jgi:hypothetical protein
MSDNINSSGSDVVAKQADATPGNVGEMTSSALARRRMLLASLGKGSAVVAAVAVPMKTMASVGTLAVLPDGQRCTISGAMSAVHSQETITAVCGGYTPGYYKKPEHWPLYNASSNPTAINPINGGSGTLNINTYFDSLCPAGPHLTLIYILQNEAPTDEFHWVAAMVNGLAASIAPNYPYTTQQIINFYNAGKGSAIYLDALNFIKTYVENI